MTKKMIHTKFGDVPEELYDKIGSIKEHREMLAANEKLKGLRADLQALNENIQSYSTEVDTEDNARQLLAGDSIEENKGITKQELFKKRDTLEMAIHLQGGEITKLEAQLTREELIRIEPLAKKLALERIKILADTEKSLKKQAELFVALRMKGFRQEYIPLKFRPSPLESQLLSGGIFPSLSLHLQKLRELWDLRSVGKHVKK